MSTLPLTTTTPSSLRRSHCVRKCRLLRSNALLPEAWMTRYHGTSCPFGKIAFAIGSRPFNEQKRRLTKENVVVLNGRIDMKKYRWQPDLDELLWKPSSTWDED